VKPETWRQLQRLLHHVRHRRKLRLPRRAQDGKERFVGVRR
jgi:hypothetical protein